MQVKRYAVGFFATLACVAALAKQEPDALPPKQPDRPDLIVPGVRIGLISIGMPIVQVLRLLGAPKKTIGYVGVMSYRYDDFIIQADNSVPPEEQVVQSINTTSTQFRTFRHLAVGSDEKTVREVMGEPSCTTSSGDIGALAYSQGISFIVNTDSRQVTEIAVRTRFC